MSLAVIENEDTYRHQLTLVSGKINSRVVNTRSSSPSGEGNLKEIPRTEGFFMLYTSVGSQPVQVIERNDIFVYRTFDGTVSPSLPSGSYLTGPIDCGLHTFDVTPVRIEESDSVVALEKELRVAYDKLSLSNKECDLLKSSLLESNKKYESEQVDILSARLAEANSEIRKIQIDYKKQFELVDELKSRAEKESNSAVSPQLLASISRAKMVLIQARLSATSDEAIEFLDDLVSELNIQ